MLWKQIGQGKGDWKLGERMVAVLSRVVRGDFTKEVKFKQRFRGGEGLIRVFWRQNTWTEQPVQRP